MTFFVDVFGDEYSDVADDADDYDHHDRHDYDGVADGAEDYNHHHRHDHDSVADDATIMITIIIMMVMVAKAWSRSSCIICTALKPLRPWALMPFIPFNHFHQQPYPSRYIDFVHYLDCSMI